MTTQLLGFIAVGLSWVAGAFLVRQWRGDPSMSLSLHAVSARPAYWLFGPTLTICGLLMAGYWFFWLIPSRQLGTAFAVIALLELTLQFITAWIPDKPGALGRIHRLAAYAMAITFLPLVAVLVGAESLPDTTRLLAALSLIYMTFALLGIVFLKQLRPHYLALQVSYIVVAQVVVLAASLF